MKILVSIYYKFLNRTLKIKYNIFTLINIYVFFG